MKNWAKYPLILCCLPSLYQADQSASRLYQPARISSELGDQDYALYARWIESLSKSDPGVHIFVLDKTQFLDPLKVPCERMSLPDPDSSDAAIWFPLHEEVDKDRPIDSEKLSKYVDSKIPYSVLSAPPPSAQGKAIVLPPPPNGVQGKVILFTRVAFREERAEAGFVYAVWKDGDRIINGQLVFGRNAEKSWRFVSPCDFAIKDVLALKAVTH